MKMLVLILILLGMSAEGYSGGEDHAIEAESLASDFNSERQEEAQKERKDMIDQLIATIENPRNHSHGRASVRQAIETLASMRAVEGVDVLVKYIGFPWVQHPDAEPYPLTYGLGRLPDSERTPAVEALVAIGEPSIPKVIAKLIETKHVFEASACMAVLRRLNAVNQAQEALQTALEDAPKRRDILEGRLNRLGAEKEDRVK